MELLRDRNDILQRTVAGTAELVRREGSTTKNVVVTAGHALFDDQCISFKPQACFFTPLFQPRRKIGISIADIGGCLHADNRAEDDWAIVELNEDVSIARPYLVPDKPIEIKDNVKVTQVTAFAGNYPSHAGHAVDCETRDSFEHKYVPFVTTCSSGHGTSGSALLQKKRNPAGILEYWIYGISVSVPEDAIDNTEYKIEGPNSNYTECAPLTGKFFERLNAVLRKHEHRQVRR